MKKVYILGIMLCACTLFNSCNDEWNEELYREMISFKAPIGSNGVHDIYVRYQSDGSGAFQLPVIVNRLNQEKYLDRRDLWYKQLPERFYSFPTENVCHIPAGKNVQTYDIDFHLEGLDLNEKWVLPLMIDKDPSYAQNVRKGYYKALLNIHLFNDY